MKLDGYLWIIEDYERKENRVRDFPQEHLGIGDRMIYNIVIRNILFNFKGDNYHLTINPAQWLAISTEMEIFGFNPNKPSSRKYF